MEMRHAVEVTSALQGYRYLNLTTFRKNGTPVVTTVWFAQVDDPEVRLAEAHVRADLALAEA